MTLKNFRSYYVVLVIYYSWHNLTNRGNSGAVLAIWGSYYKSSKELGYYYLIRKQDTTSDLGLILFTRLSTLASYKVVSLLISLKLRILFPCLIVLIVKAPDLLIRERGYLGLYIASLYKILDIFLLIPEA